MSFGNDVVGNAVTQNVTLTNTGNAGISIFHGRCDGFGIQRRREQFAGLTSARGKR